MGLVFPRHIWLIDGGIYRWAMIPSSIKSDFPQFQFRQLLKQELELNIMTQMTQCVNKIFSNFKCKQVHFIFASYT